MEVNHVAIASTSFAGFVFLTLILLGAEIARKTRNESSLMQGRRDIADRFGWGDWERMLQHPVVLEIQVWILRLITFAIFCFTCWHTANAVWN
ncbi:MAG: hypothetical protein JXR13_10420 [Thalassovita sp.]